MPRRTWGPAPAAASDRHRARPAAPGPAPPGPISPDSTDSEGPAPPNPPSRQRPERRAAASAGRPAARPSPAAAKTQAGQFPIRRGGSGTTLTMASESASRRPRGTGPGGPGPMSPGTAVFRPEPAIRHWHASSEARQRRGRPAGRPWATRPFSPWGWGLARHCCNSAVAPTNENLLGTLCGYIS